MADRRASRPIPLPLRRKPFALRLVAQPSVFRTRAGHPGAFPPGAGGPFYATDNLGPTRQETATEYATLCNVGQTRSSQSGSAREWPPWARWSQRHAASNVRFRDRPIGGPMTWKGRIRPPPKSPNMRRRRCMPLLASHHIVPMPVVVSGSARRWVRAIFWAQAFHRDFHRSCLSSRGADSANRHSSAPR